MKKKNFPETSREAWAQVTNEMISDHHKAILSALKILGTANYEKIASEVKLDRHQVGRRLKELEEKQLIYKPGTKTPSKRGRDCFDYKLTEPDKIPLPVTEKSLPGKTVSDFSKKIIIPQQEKLSF